MLGVANARVGVMTITVGVLVWGKRPGAFVLSRPCEGVKVNTSTGATSVRVGNGVRDASTGGMGVFSCGKREVLVADETTAIVDVATGAFVGGLDVGVIVREGGVLVGGCRR